jgi:hypothetical protein
MQSDNRVITPQDDDVLYKTPMNLLSDPELFSVIQYGTRVHSSLEEAVRRTESDPKFLTALFEFGDSRNENIGAKFTNWFCGVRDGVASLNASMVSSIANSELYSERAKEFIPQNLREHFSKISPGKAGDIIISYLTMIDRPDLVFSGIQGAITPVILALKYLAGHERHEEIFEAINQFLEEHIIDRGLVNNFTSGDFRNQLKTFVNGFVSKNDIDFERMALIAKTLSCFESPSFNKPELDDKSPVGELLACGLISDEIVISALNKLVSQPEFDAASLIQEITNRRSLDIISNFVSEKDMMKLGGRKVRGLLLENELGM